MRRRGAGAAERPGAGRVVAWRLGRTRAQPRARGLLQWHQVSPRAASTQAHLEGHLWAAAEVSTAPHADGRAHRRRWSVTAMPPGTAGSRTLAGRADSSPRAEAPVVTPRPWLHPPPPRNLVGCVSVPAGARLGELPACPWRALPRTKLLLNRGCGPPPAPSCLWDWERRGPSCLPAAAASMHCPELGDS